MTNENRQVEGGSIKRQVAEELDGLYDHSLILLDGFDEALIGIATVPGQPARLAYDVAVIISIIKSWGSTQEEAEEYYSFNIECLWCGEGTPVLVDKRLFDEHMDSVSNQKGKAQ